MGAIELFRRLDRNLWETTRHNPVLMLGTIEQQRLEQAAEDDAFLAHMEAILQRFDRYMQRREGKNGWYQKAYNSTDNPTIAYFSAEFGLTDCIPNYSGGLGVLSGDHVKSASDLGIPLIGVGLLYQQGYFHQYLSSDGWQQERYPLNDFYTMPLQLERHKDGTPLTVEIELGENKAIAQIWRVQVGRVPLYLLDTNVDSNPTEIRDITDQLYGGDNEMRICQEIILGIGGLRALRARGIEPVVCHLNEGHAAFLALERIRLLMEQQGLTFAQAREAAAAGNVFTTHTPVPAGIDRFPPALMDKYFGPYYKTLGLSRKEFLSLGRMHPENNDEPFNMAVLSLNLSAAANAVSKLHAVVSRRMWKDLWPGVPENETPIHPVTNGTHLLSWISHDMANLYDRYLGPIWREDPADPEVWARVDEIPDAELWRTHERRRERLVAFARRKLRAQLESRGAPPSQVEAAWDALDPEALTIGFARRFATYKRATLLLRDSQRLAQILNAPDRPVQIIFAGKAHPRDQAGKELIQDIVHLARQNEFRRRIVFLEDYDMEVARYMVQGVDLWLNTPRRFQEASGTSGMKATANGAINMSILDGWWDEAYRPDFGWAIGRGEVYEDHTYQDEIESKGIYDLLEKEVVPFFYDRGPDGLPRRWIAKIKAATKAICPYFNTNRMVREYTESFYLPTAERFLRLTKNDMERAKTLARWKENLARRWLEIHITHIETDTPEEVKVGDEIKVRALIQLGGLDPTDVTVQLYHGLIDDRGEIVPQAPIEMECTGCGVDGHCNFIGVIPCQLSGRYGYTIRILPFHEDLSHPFETRLIVWAG
jgi:starch phosphorylase